MCGSTLELLTFDDVIDLLLRHHERRQEVSAHEVVALAFAADLQCANTLLSTLFYIPIDARKPYPCVQQSEIDYRPIFVPHIDRYAIGFAQ